AKSGSLEPLTSGDWEVTDLDRVGGGQAWFTSTAEGPEERHFYRVALGGGEPVRLTTQPGWNECRVSSDGSWIACLHSDLTDPVDLWVERPGSGKPPERITRSPAKDFDPTLLAVPEIITLKSRLDGAPVTAALYRPDPGAPPDDLSRGLRPHPALVHVHGGGYSQAVRRGWGGWMTFINTLFVRQGYYVLDVDYRGSSGYGRKWRTDVRLNLGGPDLEDTLTAAEYLRSLPDVDPGRVGVWGWSYGGFLTCMSMMAKPGVFNAGVAIAPVTDWAAYDTHYTEERLGLPSEHAEAYRKGSPLTYAGRLRDPFLLVHGLRDDNVHVQDSIRLVDELVRDGKDFDVMFYPEAKHGIRSDASRIHLFKKVFAFFLEKMPPRR
ncbi:MAG TPA: prolyl oligopeptidase family serine peptidase, partial [Candidatus Saccharimonadales bacterium]|nr:prolyl oligopeptidase family serine peptidase [Candidatus Saccharimonadales bacterium]